MRLVITGGHLSVALSVIEELPKNTKILFIGRKNVFEGDEALSLEYKTIKDSLKIPFVGLNTARLQRKFTKYTIPSLLKFPYGVIQAFLALNKFKPDVVVGFGGYVSLPAIISAFLLRLPIVIHEQTLRAGLANRIASFFANKICISWETSRRFFPKEKTVLTGNPVRRFKVYDLRFMIAKEDQKLPIIYVTGGSSGSHFINTLILYCIKVLLSRFIVIHQVGDSKDRDFEELKRISNTLSLKLKHRYILQKFFDTKDVGSILQKANLVISRSGINTITELIYFKKPAILIPIPFSQNNEQVKNALFFKSLGLGEIIFQESLKPNLFLQKVTEMFNNIEKYKESADKLESLGSQDAADKIVKVIEYVKKSKEV